MPQMPGRGIRLTVAGDGPDPPASSTRTITTASDRELWTAARRQAILVCGALQKDHGTEG